MNKPLLGLLLGAVLGAIDGVLAPVGVPEIAPQAMSIVIGSTGKGLLVGLLAGFFARKYRSVPLGILVGCVAGFLFAYLVVATGAPYFWRITLPGAITGAIVGWATQRYGRAPADQKVV